MKKVFCGECIHYRGNEKVPNPKSTAWMDSNRPKCAISKSIGTDKNYYCPHYESDGLNWGDGSRAKRHRKLCES